MNASKTQASATASRHTRDLLRDPALWAWLLVALLAIFPAKSVFAHDSGGKKASSLPRVIDSP